MILDKIVPPKMLYIWCFREECDTQNDEVCDTIREQKCETIPEEECTTVNEEVCDSIEVNNK